MLSFQLMLESLFSKWHNSMKCTNGTYRYKYLLISSRLSSAVSFNKTLAQTSAIVDCYSKQLSDNSVQMPLKFKNTINTVKNSSLENQFPINYLNFMRWTTVQALPFWSCVSQCQMVVSISTTQLFVFISILHPPCLFFSGRQPLSRSYEGDLPGPGAVLSEAFTKLQPLPQLAASLSINICPLYLGWGPCQ